MRKKKISQKVRFGSFLAILGMLAAGKGWADTTNTVSSSTPSDPLLDLFVKKGYVTQQEADQVKAEAQQEQSNYVAHIAAQQSIWKITDGIKKVELYGDVRFRYERRNATDGADNIIQMNRVRYALRLGLRGDAFDDFYYGIRLETAQNPRSPWVTLGTSSTTSPYQGPFGKSAGGINVGQIYMGWRWDDAVNITIGKMPNLIYTTPMLWDTDINPEGAVEAFKHTVGQADLFANFAQYYYASFNPNEASPGLGIGIGTTGVGQQTRNLWMFVWQGGFTYHVTPTTSAKMAATLYNYAGLQKSTTGNPETSPYFGDPYIGEGAYYINGGHNFGFAPGFAGYSPGTQFNTLPGNASLSYPLNQVGLNDLLVLETPFEVDFRVNNIATRIFGDFAYNLEGSQRAQEAASAYAEVQAENLVYPNAIPHTFAAQTHDVKAYQIGFGFGSDDLVYGPTAGLVYGSGSHKHDWEFRTYWQHIEQYSLDPNLIDSDFFEGRENLQGIYAALAYAVSDNVILTVRYGQAWRINDILGTGGDNQDIPQMNPINHYHLFQADADFRF